MDTSIIVPVYNGADALSECLAALKPLSNPNIEIIVVDDASTDDTSIVAARAGAKLIRLPKNSGPAAARNYGARHAMGEILFFLDSDVVLAPDAFTRIEKAFREKPDLAAIFGSYDANPKAPGLVSQYRNLLHHYVHQNGNSEASTFWAGCGAIRRFVFEKLGGFDEKRFPRSSIEDIELGYRLRRFGYRILLDKKLQGTHLKQWNLYSLIRTDITCRAIPWSRLILETKNAPNDLNLNSGQKLSVGLVALSTAFLFVSVVRPEFVVLSAVVLLPVVFLNRKLYAFFLRRRGIVFTAASISLHFLYYLYSGISYLWVWTDLGLRRASNLCAIYPRYKAWTSLRNAINSFMSRNFQS